MVEESTVKAEGTKQVSPERQNGAGAGKDVKMSTATTPTSDRCCTLHIQKQLASVARGLWHRVCTVVSDLCHALQVPLAPNPY